MLYNSKRENTGVTMGYKVKLNVFEGPFDLLVYLIESARMNIYDIQVSEITAQYIHYINEMKQMDVSVSSDFMVLAAELIDLKSKMLLPRITSEGEEAINEDPRSELIEKLLEYKRFKNISEMLSEKEENGFRVYEKPQEDISKYIEDPDEFLKLDIHQFVTAFNIFLNKKKKVEEIKQRYERIERQKISAEARIAFIKKMFDEDNKKSLPFGDLVLNKKDKYDVVLSFSSVLEMIKQKRLEAEQQRLFGEIIVKATEYIDNAVVEEKQEVRINDKQTVD